ncbi:ubiquinone/menaquinone biosynthesis C-methylase UbiE [Desulfobaculum xiamenense]|uniref:Ubiquinone/menaquinone biosynthesis C-methylase UbiE n=1 Tax=Desulfobaculum xiamenense TaxID=995050 RepID=A0A846QMG7_9BACT|nr:class I SAM-dependent methyltransferase [Desulfobaculum xiamenense]NJB68377.1 ubiquinone/menaquinone biosynthesis C-methylase UbiE [Desulfobaculum xiamenense]
MSERSMKPGDFTALAQNYSAFRPRYADIIVDTVFGLQNRPAREIDVVDVGAGTGIWTRMMAQKGPASIRAVEPNDEMRRMGVADSSALPIQWCKGNAENTGLETDSCDILSMASSFHWADFDSAVKEFDRVLRPGGIFLALWNPREIKAGSIFDEIEHKIYELNPAIKRRSSGNSTFTDGLFASLTQCGLFRDVLYMESFHKEMRSVDAYIGAWRSVNDVRSQLGEEKFEEFLAFVEQRLDGMNELEVEYRTRAWIARKRA